MSAFDTARFAAALLARHGSPAAVERHLVTRGFAARAVRSWVRRERRPTDDGILRVAETYPDDAEFMLDALAVKDARWVRLLAHAAAEDRLRVARAEVSYLSRSVGMREALRRLSDEAIARFWISDTGIHAVEDLQEGVIGLLGLPAVPDGDLVAQAIRGLGWIAVTIPAVGPARADMSLKAVLPGAIAALGDAAGSLGRSGMVIAHELEVMPPLPASLIPQIAARLLVLADAVNDGIAGDVTAEDQPLDLFAQDRSLGLVWSAWSAAGGRLTAGLADLLAEQPAGVLYSVDPARGVSFEAIGEGLPLLYDARAPDLIGRPLLEMPMPEAIRTAVGAVAVQTMIRRQPTLQKIQCRDAKGYPVRYRRGFWPLKGAAGDVVALFSVTTDLRMEGVR